LTNRFLRLIAPSALAVCVLCAAFAFTLSVVAYGGAQETGGGAAQGDLGFFLILLAATRVVALLLIGAVLVAWRTGTRPNSRVHHATYAAALAAAVAMAWNWLFLFVFWRA
jgi:hypothetical protein